MSDDSNNFGIVTCARELNFYTARMVRAMLAEGDIQSLQAVGCGTPERALAMLRCYELATLRWWDVEALADASELDGIGARLGESRAATVRRIWLAIKGGEAPELIHPVDGVALLYRLHIRVADELEETVAYLENIGFYNSVGAGDDRSTQPSALAETSSHTPPGEIARETSPIQQSTLADAPAVQTDSTVGLPKRERQIRAIEAAAAAEGYDMLKIPTGGKSKLRKKCQESNPALFGAGSDPFDDAWKAAIACDPPRLRMADHSKFSGR